MSMIALCACNPPVVRARIVALCNPHFWAGVSGVTDGHKQSTENCKIQLCWERGGGAARHKPLTLPGVTPALKSFATSCDS